MTNILVIAGDHWHPAEIPEGGFRLLEGEEFHFDFVRDAEKSLTREKLFSYPIVINCRSNNLDMNRDEYWFIPGRKTAGPGDFRDYVEQGGTLVAAHAGSSFRESLSDGTKAGIRLAKEYTDLIGCHFVNHPPMCPVRISVVNPEHPIMRDVEDFTVTDEHYILEMTAEFCSVLFETDSEEGGCGRVGGYVRPVGSGRVVVLTPGHTAEVWSHPEIQKILRNTLMYCVYGE